MAVAYRTSTVGGNTAGTDPSLAITAVAGDLLLVFFSVSDMATLTVTDDAGGTYTRVGSGLWGTGDFGVGFVRNTLVTTGASITITGDTDTNTAVVQCNVAISGMFRAGSSAVRGHGMIAGKAAASVTATLSRLPRISTNLIVGFLASADTTITPPTDFVERQESSQITPTTCLEVITRDPSGTDPTSLATTGQAQWTAITGDSIAMLIELESLPVQNLALVNVQRFDWTVTADYTDGLTTYVPSPNVRAVEIEFVAGGGGGGNGTTIAGAAGGGGASGEWGRIYYESSANIAGGAVAVGAGGAAAAAGGNSSITIDGITFTVSGGTAGITNTTAGSYSDATAVALKLLGNTSFDINRGSTASTPAMVTATTTITAYTAGVGGSTPFGLGGRGSGGDADGAPGTGYGTGGGGGRRNAATDRSGGVGAPGYIIVREYVLVPTAAEIADAVWDEIRSGHVIAGSFGENVLADATKWNGTAVAAPTTAGIPKVEVDRWRGATQPNALLSGMVEAVPSIHSGTATAGAASTITLAASASATSTVYVPLWISVISGTGAGQCRRITGYVGGTKVATVNAAWTTNPDATSVYVISPNSLGQIDAMSNNTITANTINSTAFTAAKFATDAIDANALAASAVTEIQSGLATSAALATAQTAITAIKTVTDQIVFTVANRVDAQVIGMQPNTLTASALAADAVAEIQSGLATAAALSTAQTDITALTAKLLLVQFLLQGNAYVDSTVHTANGTTSARLRGFASAASTAAATDGAADGAQGEVARWTVTTEYDGVGQVKTHKFVQQLP